MRNLFIVVLLLVAVAASAQEKPPPGISQVVLVGIYMERTPQGINGYELLVWVAQKDGNIIIPAIFTQKKLIRQANKLPLGCLVFIEGRLARGHNEYGESILIVKTTKLQWLFN